MPTSTNKFEFLENVLTSESLQALRRVDKESRRKAMQSMTANQKSGFAVGTMIFGALSNAFGPGKKRKELAAQGDAALAAASDQLESIPESEFEGPHGGLKRNLARARALADSLKAQGLQEDAMRAQIAANNFQTQLVQAQEEAETRELTQEGQRSLNEQRRLANEANRRAGALNAQTYYLNTETGDIVDRLDSRKASFPTRQERILNNNPNILPLARSEYLEYMQDRASEVADEDFAILTKTRLDDSRQTLVAQNQMLDMGNRLLQVWNEAEGNPLTTVNAAERFGNRIVNELEQARNFYDANLAQAREAGQDVSEEARVRDVERWMQERGIERQISASLIQRLTWTLTRQFNGSRPTDKDYERIFMMLGGDAGDPLLAATALRELFASDARSHLESFNNLLNTQNDAGRRYGDTTQGRVLQNELNDMQQKWSTWQDTFSTIEENFSKSRPAEPEDTQNPNSFFEGQFSIGGAE